MMNLRMKQWAFVFSMLTVPVACIANHLTETCADDSTCGAPPTGAAGGGQVGDRVDGGGKANDRVSDGGAIESCSGHDLRTDPNHCGACNHSCMGGACSEGRCLPLRIAAIPNAGELAFDNDGMFVTVPTDPGGVYYVPTGADAGVFPIATEASPAGPSTDGARTCWASSSRVTCSLRDGGAARSSVNGDSPRSTAIVGGYVYWVASRAGALRRAKLDKGGAPTLVATVDSMALTTGHRALVFDAGRLFWLAASAHQLVAAAPGDGFPVTNVAVIASIPNGTPNALAIAPDAYYIAAEDNGTDRGGIFRAAKGGPNGATAAPFLRQSLVAPYIALDKSHAYYTDRITSSIYRMPLDTALPDGCISAGTTGGPEIIATGQTSPGAIRVDDRFVYWVTGGANGGLMRLAK